MSQTMQGLCEAMMSNSVKRCEVFVKGRFLVVPTFSAKVLRKRKSIRHFQPNRVSVEISYA